MIWATLRVGNGSVTNVQDRFARDRQLAASVGRESEMNLLSVAGLAETDLYASVPDRSMLAALSMFREIPDAAVPAHAVVLVGRHPAPPAPAMAPAPAVAAVAAPMPAPAAMTAPGTGAIAEHAMSDGATATATKTTYTIHRPTGPESVDGAVSCDVRDGALIVLGRAASGGDFALRIYAPGQWLAAEAAAT